MDLILVWSGEIRQIICHWSLVIGHWSFAGQFGIGDANDQ
jgi:hypothetical protein